MPVCVTFGLYLYLGLYYVFFFLIPTINKDFSSVSFEKSWAASEAELEKNSKNAVVYAGIFAFTASMLLISISRTILTNPGNIPEDREWDMSTDTSAGEEVSQMSAG